MIPRENQEEKIKIESSVLDRDLFGKIKMYIYILSTSYQQENSEEGRQKDEYQFTVDDLKYEFNDNFEVPKGVELEDELWKLGIVRLRYATGTNRQEITIFY